MKKKVFLIFGILLFACNSLFARRIEVYKRGSDDGVHFNSVVEKHTFNKDKLTCVEPGEIVCDWSGLFLSFEGGITYNQVDSYVMKQIEMGYTSGNTLYNGVVQVSWSTDSDGGLTIIMTDEIVKL